MFFNWDIHTQHYDVNVERDLRLDLILLFDKIKLYGLSFLFGSLYINVIINFQFIRYWQLVFFFLIYIYNTSDEKEWLWIWSHSLFRTLQDLYLLALVVMSDEIWTKRLCNLIGLTGSSSAILIIGRGDSFSTSKSGVLVKHIHPLSTAHQNIPFNNVIYKMVWSLFI